MESDAKAELNELDRLDRTARVAASAWPQSASILMSAAAVVFIALYWSLGSSTPLIAVWLAFLAIFYVVLWTRRRARARRPWATEQTRRRVWKNVLATVIVNAVWIPLFFFARPVAFGLLIAALLLSLLSQLRYRHA